MKTKCPALTRLCTMLHLKLPAHLVHHHLGRRQHIVEGLGAVEPWVSQDSLNIQPLLWLHLQQPAVSRKGRRMDGKKVQREEDYSREDRQGQ